MPSNPNSNNNKAEQETLITRVAIQLGKIHRELQGHTHWTIHLIEAHGRDLRPPSGKSELTFPQHRVETLVCVSDDLIQAATAIEAVKDNDARETLESWHTIVSELFFSIWERHEQLMGQRVS